MKCKACGKEAIMELSVIIGHSIAICEDCMARYLAIQEILESKTTRRSAILKEDKDGQIKAGRATLRW